MEDAIQHAWIQQYALELKAKTIAQSLDTVLAKIDKIQSDQGRTIVEHEKVISEQQKHQQELTQTAERKALQRQQTTIQTQLVHGRQNCTEDELSQAATVLKTLNESQEKFQAQMASRQEMRENETLKVQQQLQQLMSQRSSSPPPPTQPEPGVPVRGYRVGGFPPPYEGCEVRGANYVYAPPPTRQRTSSLPNESEMRQPDTLPPESNRPLHPPIPSMQDEIPSNRRFISVGECLGGPTAQSSAPNNNFSYGMNSSQTMTAPAILDPCPLFTPSKYRHWEREVRLWMETFPTATA